MLLTDFLPCLLSALAKFDQDFENGRDLPLRGPVRFLLGSVILGVLAGVASGEVEVQDVVQACIGAHYLLVSLYVSILWCMVSVCRQVPCRLLVSWAALVARLYPVNFCRPQTWRINLLIKASIELFDTIGSVE